MAAKANFSKEEIQAMPQVVRSFLYFWCREIERERNQEFGRLLGAHFTAGEVRRWQTGSGDKGTYADEDVLFIPLSLAMKPELREGLTRMVGGVRLPTDYKKAANEVVVDMGQVSPEAFKEFVRRNRIVPQTPG